MGGQQANEQNLLTPQFNERGAIAQTIIQRQQEAKKVQEQDAEGDIDKGLDRELRL